VPSLPPSLGCLMRSGAKQGPVVAHAVRVVLAVGDAGSSDSDAEVDVRGEIVHTEALLRSGVAQSIASSVRGGAATRSRAGVGNDASVSSSGSASGSASGRLDSAAASGSNTFPSGSGSGVGSGVLVGSVTEAVATAAGSLTSAVPQLAQLSADFAHLHRVGGGGGGGSSGPSVRMHKARNMSVVTVEDSGIVSAGGSAAAGTAAAGLGRGTSFNDGGGARRRRAQVCGPAASCRTAARAVVCCCGGRRCTTCCTRRRTRPVVVCFKRQRRCCVGPQTEIYRPSDVGDGSGYRGNGVYVSHADVAVVCDPPLQRRVAAASLVAASVRASCLRRRGGPAAAWAWRTCPRHTRTSPTTAAGAASRAGCSSAPVASTRRPLQASSRARTTRSSSARQRTASAPSGSRATSGGDCVHSAPLSTLVAAAVSRRVPSPLTHLTTLCLRSRCSRCRGWLGRVQGSGAEARGSVHGPHRCRSHVRRRSRQLYVHRQWGVGRLLARVEGTVCLHCFGACACAWCVV
jgi:hypothetical protein